MAMVARCRIEVSAGTVRVSTGKYRCSMGLAEWRGAVSASMRGPVALPPGRGRVVLANGLVVRAHGSDGAGEVWRASLERARPPLPPPPPRGRDRLGAMAPLLERVAEAVLNEQVAEIRALLPAYELCLPDENPEDTRAAFGGEAWRVAEEVLGSTSAAREFAQEQMFRPPPDMLPDSPYNRAPQAEHCCRVIASKPPHHSHFSRLSRWLLASRAGRMFE